MLAACLSTSEADMVDVIDYIGKTVKAFSKDYHSQQVFGPRRFCALAHSRLHWKLKMPHGATAADLHHDKQRASQSSTLECSNAFHESLSL